MIKYILLLLLTLTSCGPFSPFIQKPSNPLNPFDPLRHKPKSTLEQGLEKMNEMMELVKKYEQEFIIHFNELKEKVNAKNNNTSNINKTKNVKKLIKGYKHQQRKLSRQMLINRDSNDKVIYTNNPRPHF